MGNHQLKIQKCLAVCDRGTAVIFLSTDAPSTLRSLLALSVRYSLCDE